MSQAAVRAEITDILEKTCVAHKLPLALAWISSNSLKKSKRTLDVVDTACYMTDSCLQGFVEACKLKNLEEGQGVAGKALESTHHYSISNVCSHYISDYPLVDDASSFGLRAALAIKLTINEDYRSGFDYVVEFFLPTNMEGSEEKKLMDEILGSLRNSCEYSLTVGA